MATHDHQLPVLSDNQKAWLIDARANGLSFAEMAGHFRDVFPDYAEDLDIPDDIFEKLFTFRVKQLLNNSQSSAKLYLDAKQNGELPINVEGIPLFIARIRLACYQRLWDETPARTLQRIIKRENGEEVEIWKDNTKERLSILSEVRKELQFLGIEPEGTGQPTPVGDSEGAVNEDEKDEDGVQVLSQAAGNMFGGNDANSSETE